MKDWALLHPFLTTFIIFCALLAIEAILREWARAVGSFGRKRKEEDAE